MRRPWIRWCSVLGLCVLAACSREPLSAPTAPSPHSITGHLRLTGFTVDADGQFMGRRDAEDADGILVELLHGSNVVAQTRTVKGNYHFSGLGAGDYVARSRVIGDIGDQTSPLVIAKSDVFAADTLHIISAGEIYPVPNPFEHSTRFYFHVPDSMWVQVDVRNSRGNIIRNLRAVKVAPGGHIVFWDGRDQGGVPADEPLFWITLVAGADIRAHLLFREATPPPRDPRVAVL